MRFIVLIIIIFFLIVLGVLIFGGNKKTPPATQVKTLADYASTAAEAQLTTDGEINGDDAHRQIVITVGRDQRVIQVIQGYQGTVLKSESFANNQSAYSAFLSALNVAGYLKERTIKTPEAGQCPLGQRYNYEIINNDDKNMNTWSTSCGAGSFGGQSSLVRQLFRLQITNYDEFTSDVAL